MKDLFSEGSALYQKARPTYPSELMDEILKYVPSRQFAWDCGAGSGQLTQLMVPYFEQIVATDLSAQQLHQATYYENVSYQVQSAEQTTFANQSFDLITVAQAIHWFNFEKFYSEVRRTLKVNGVLAVIGYGTPILRDELLQTGLQELYANTLNGYWDPERKHIDHEYQDIPFPFESLTDQKRFMKYTWSKEQVLNYLNTWSAIKHYREQNNLISDHQNPLDPLYEMNQKLEKFVGLIEIQFPIFLKIGKVKNHSSQKTFLRDKVKIHKIFKRETSS